MASVHDTLSVKLRDKISKDTYVLMVSQRENIVNLKESLQKKLSERKALEISFDTSRQKYIENCLRLDTIMKLLQDEGPDIGKLRQQKTSDD